VESDDEFANCPNRIPVDLELSFASTDSNASTVPAMDLKNSSIEEGIVIPPGLSITRTVWPTISQVDLDALSVSGDEDYINEHILSGNVEERETSTTINYQVPPIVDPYFRTVDNLPLTTSTRPAKLIALTESRRLSGTSQFTTFLEHFVTNCPSDSARRLTKILPSIQKIIIDYTNGNFSSLVDYFAENPVIPGSLEEHRNRPSTSTSVPSTSNLERAELHVVKVRKRLRLNLEGPSTSAESSHPRTGYRRCPVCSQLCTPYTALMWQNCSHCLFPVHFECDELFLHYNPYICQTCRNVLLL